MAAANAWSTAVPPSQLRPASSNSQEIFHLSNKIYSISLPSKYRLNKSTLSCCCTNNFENTDYREGGTNNTRSLSSASSSSSSSPEWDWNRWTRHFSEVEQAARYASLLKFQLEEAIEKQDFQEAAKLKIAIEETMSKDSVAEIMYQLKSAIDDERYHDASSLCRSTGSGLIGWWVGYPNADDPFGKLIRITPETGRFVGRSYLPRQLVTSAPGTPLFEIFVVKHTNGTYKMQVVYLKKNKQNRGNVSSDTSTKRKSSTGVENGSIVESEQEESKEDKIHGNNLDLEGAAEEGLKSDINFLKANIPELKLKVMKANATQDITEDTLEQLIEDDSTNTTSVDSAEEGSDTDNSLSDIVTGEGDSNTTEDELNHDMDLIIAGVLLNNEDTPTSDEFVRIPADIEDIKRDSFLLHIPKGNQDNDSKENASYRISELFPPRVAKAFGNSNGVSSEISRKMRELAKLAAIQAHQENQLSEYTNFCRISTSKGDTDPFDGLYISAFAHYCTGIVQLKRKYGNWNMNNDEESSEVEFFEYVEAVKLTGVDPGQVMFRAKIGKAHRLANHGKYLNELGVVASYRGQGRVEDPGLGKLEWIEGELLQLNGKGMGPYEDDGADLGFIYFVPGKSVLVLFDRLKLPE